MGIEPIDAPFYPKTRKSAGISSLNSCLKLQKDHIGVVLLLGTAFSVTLKFTAHFPGARKFQVETVAFAP